MRHVLIGPAQGMILGLALFLAGATVPARADPAGIETAIRGQMQAFRGEDVEGAFGFASDGIRRIFVTPERFGAMVRHGYPMVWAPGEVQLLELRFRDRALWQRVRVLDGEGLYHLLDYRMVQSGSGPGAPWRIDAVLYLGAAGLGA